MGLMDLVKNGSRVRKGELIVAFIADWSELAEDGTMWVSSPHGKGAIGTQVILDTQKGRSWEGRAVEVGGKSQVGAGHWYRVLVLDELP